MMTNYNENYDNVNFVLTGNERQLKRINEINDLMEAFETQTDN